MKGDSGHPRQNIAFVTGSSSAGASTFHISCHPVGRRFAQSRIPVSRVRRMVVVRWTGRGRRTARMRTKDAIAVTAPSTDKATATTATATISSRVVIVGSRMAHSLEHPVSTSFVTMRPRRKSWRHGSIIGFLTRVMRRYTFYNCREGHDTQVESLAQRARLATKFHTNPILRPVDAGIRVGRVVVVLEGRFGLIPGGHSGNFPTHPLIARKTDVPNQEGGRR